MDTAETDEERQRLKDAAKALDCERPPDNPLAGAPTLSLEQLRELYIAHVLEWTDTQDEAAQLLGVNASTLYRRTRRPKP